MGPPMGMMGGGFPPAMMMRPMSAGMVGGMNGGMGGMPPGMGGMPPMPGMGGMGMGALAAMGGPPPPSDPAAAAAAVGPTMEPQHCPKWARLFCGGMECSRDVSILSINSATKQRTFFMSLD